MISKRYYFDLPYGQLHYTAWGDLEENKRVLLCLSPSPFSHISYNTIAPMLAAEYYVVAVDYPGLGNSDGPSGTLTIGLIAEAVIELVRAFRSKNRIDVLGFHSGALVAIEAAVCSVDLFQNLILVDVPFFDEDERSLHLSKNYGQIKLSPNLSCLQTIWDSCVTNRLDTLGLKRGFELFLDQASLGERGGIIFEAAFKYDCFRQARKVKTPTTVIATRAGLYEESLKAHSAISNAKLVTVEDVSVSVLENAASQISDCILVLI